MLRAANTYAGVNGVIFQRSNSKDNAQQATGYRLSRRVQRYLFRLGAAQTERTKNAHRVLTYRLVARRNYKVNNVEHVLSVAGNSKNQSSNCSTLKCTFSAAPMPTNVTLCSKTFYFSSLRATSLREYEYLGTSRLFSYVFCLCLSPLCAFTHVEGPRTKEVAEIRDTLEASCIA